MTMEDVQQAGNGVADRSTRSGRANDRKRSGNKGGQTMSQTSGSGKKQRRNGRISVNEEVTTSPVSAPVSYNETNLSVLTMCET